MAPVGAEAAAANDLLLQSCDLIRGGPGLHPSSSSRDSVSSCPVLKALGGYTSVG